MGPLIVDDRANSSMGVWIAVTKIAQLGFEMHKHDSFYCDRGGANRRAATQTRNKTENKTPDATKMIAAAPPDAPALQFGGEDSAMPLFVVLEILELTPKLSASPATGQTLSPVNIHCTMFTGVVHL